MPDDLVTITHEDLPERLQLRGKPKQKRTREAYNRILDAAIDLAYEQGLANINTNMIAERAELDIASLYRIFPNKESIFYWAADRLLSDIRRVCNEMNGDDYQHLDWRAFFATHGEKVMSIVEYQKSGAPLMPLWANFPEFQQMLNTHYAYLTHFFVGHLQRFGSEEPRERLEHLMYYLVMNSDATRDVAPSMGKEREAAFYRLDYETWMFHLERVLPG